MERMDTWSQDTIDSVIKALQKDATSQGYGTDLNLTGIELAEYARVLIPSLTPFRNAVPRVAAKIGSKTTMWRSILSANTTNVRPTAALGSGGIVPFTAEADFMAAYSLITQGGKVTDDAIALANGFDDAKALSVQNTLIDLMKQEDILLLGGQNFTLGTPGTIVLTPSVSGGTIASGVNVQVACAARTMQGAQDGQSTAASAAVASGALGGTTLGSIAATIPWVKGAFCYDWYVGLNSGTLYYYKTTTVNAVTITAVPTVGATVTGAPSIPSIPGYNSVNTTTGVVTFTAIDTAAKCTTDRSADANSMNGFAATLVGDIQFVGNANILVQNGTQTPGGATLTSLNGGTLTGNSGTILQIDDILDSLWQKSKVSPNKIYCNARTRRAISDLMVSSGGYTTLAPMQSPDVRRAAVGGIMEMQYMNKSGEGYLDIVPLPWIPEGTIMIATEKLAFPNSRISNVFEVETQKEYNMYPYPSGRNYGTNGGPRYEYDVRAIETFKNYFAGAHAMIQNVGY